MGDVLHEDDSLRAIFSREPWDALFQAKLGQLCAAYLDGAWAQVDCASIQVTAATGGANNLIFVVKLPEGTSTEYGEPHAAILRIYRNLGENRELPEGLITAVLAERGLGPALHGAFPGGRFEQYIPSRILTNEQYCKPCVAREVGCILARIHSLDMPVNKQLRLVHFLDEMLGRLKRAARWSRGHPMRTTLARVNKKLCPDEITIDLLAEELEICKKCLARSGSPIVFSNNDLHEGNLLLRDGFEITDQGIAGSSDDSPLVLIDYEYACYYYRGFDLCHYCVECCQNNEGREWPYYQIKQEQWPSEEVQREYIGSYLDEAVKVKHLCSCIRGAPHEVVELYLEVCSSGKGPNIAVPRI
ncbi:unnamed protein product [Gongylonema pulchrum]|uniref:Choline/ethanolamine kinase n=1 Tax=Gongylonema pulchrum TaxID=637853 RepID=A0A183E8K1_9BILA|nr:unnamed protein product [Gongylonema pulchrum]